MISVQTPPTIAAVQTVPSAVSGAPSGGGEYPFPSFLELLTPLAPAPGGDAWQVSSAIGNGLPVVADIFEESVTRRPDPTPLVPDTTATLATFLARTARKPPTPTVAPVQPRAIDEESDGATATDDIRSMIPMPLPLPVPMPPPEARVLCGGGLNAHDVDIETGPSSPAIQTPRVARDPVGRPNTDPTGATLSVSGPVDTPPVQPGATDEAIEAVTVPFAPDARITCSGSESRDPEVQIGSRGTRIPSPAVPQDPVPPATVESASPAVPALTPAPVTIAAMSCDPQPSPDTLEDEALVPAPPKITAAAMPLIVAPEPGARGPAGRLFAAAIHTASRDEAPAFRAIDTLTPITTPPTALDATTLAVNAAGAASRAPLDLRQGDWPARMIDRIETLRDAADALDTRIRVVPDALGTIDVSLRREGDTVHVQFSAEQADTRALLGEAQPRLAELAELRGLKLAQGSVGDGTGQQPQRQPRTTPVTPVVPRHALTETRDTDHRLA